jgi:hypothetical protein
MTEADKDPSPPAPASSSAEDAPGPQLGPASAPAASVEPASTPAASVEPVSTSAASAEPTKAATDATDEPVVKRSKKGKRKRKASAESESASGGARSQLDRDGRERPAFLLNFPHDPELEPLIAAFEAGNYAYVREFAPKLAEHSGRPEVKAAAAELRKRIDPDPLVKFLVAVALLLFIAVLTLVYRSRG